MQLFLTTSFKQFFLINILLLLPIITFGFLFAIMKKKCNRNIRKSVGYFGTLIFGVIGVPIHEMSHFIMCILFRHTVTEVSLFRPGKGRYDNVLGYVKHKYNKNSIYQTAGCFFIGIAPMIIGSSIIVFIIRLIFPSLINNLKSFDGFDTLKVNILTTTIFYNTKLIISTLFQLSNLTNIFFWVSVYIIVSIALHMTISKADFDNALSGFALLEIILFIFTLGLNVFGLESSGILLNIEHISSVLLSVLFIASIMFGIVYFFSYIIYRLVN
ncbi:MAG: hypothetical protein ACERKZ_17480 [Lachnotalea sp.]